MDGGNDPDFTNAPEVADAPDAASGSWGEFQLVEELGVAPSDVCTGRGTPRSRKMSP